LLSVGFVGYLCDIHVRLWDMWDTRGIFVGYVG
jgi:hypothetical protein